MLQRRGVRLEVGHLRRRLVLLDVLAVSLAWLPAQIWKISAGMQWWKWLITEAVLVSSGLLLCLTQGLYLARIASSRSEEIKRIVRTAVVLGLVQVGLLGLMSVEVEPVWLWLGPALLVVLLLWMRGGYRAWLSAERAKGRYLRDVLVIGANGDAADVVDMLREHPEAGFRVIGVVGDPTAATVHGLGSLFLGTPQQTLDLVDRTGVSGVVCVAGSLPANELTRLVSALEGVGVHIQISTGMHGMSHRRLRATPVAYQSLYYLEPASTSNLRMTAKRGLDLLVAGCALVVFSPVMALIALAIKLTDRGPILFGQTRVGRDGEPFRVWKFRSMVVDAEARLAELQRDNERTGPLFKLERDPRVTRIGRFIRSTSLDELPQLFNVIRGQMSIVGPRPALPSEVAQFDERLLDRLRMPPGITGLWQVEARDNPHFGAYRRLDLFYVDNWTLTLDLVILVATIEQVLSKALRSLVGGRSEDETWTDGSSELESVEGVPVAPVAQGAPVVPLAGARPVVRSTPSDQTRSA